MYLPITICTTLSIYWGLLITVYNSSGAVYVARIEFFPHRPHVVKIAVVYCVLLFTERLACL
jgi:hypothetical protein